MTILEDLFAGHFGCKPESCALLPQSGSARKYYRLSGGGVTVIGCQGTNRAENRAFIGIASVLRLCGLHAPEVFACSGDTLCYLQEDLGGGQLFDLLGPAIASGSFGPEQKRLLKKAVAVLPSVQVRAGALMDWSLCFPDREFNARMVDFDLNYFKYDFLKFTGLGFDEPGLQDDFDRLRTEVLRLDTDKCFMYRDFQARNIMIKDGEPCLIDFQGGRRGPVQYDLASFIRNVSCHFPTDIRAMLEQTYVEALGEYRKVDPEQFHEQLRLFSLLRLLQECGAYGFRGLYERKQVFLDGLPFVRECIAALLSEGGLPEYPCLESVLRAVANDWNPDKYRPQI